MITTVHVPVSSDSTRITKYAVPVLRYHKAQQAVNTCFRFILFHSANICFNHCPYVTLLLLFECQHGWDWGHLFFIFFDGKNSDLLLGKKILKGWSKEALLCQFFI